LVNVRINVYHDINILINIYIYVCVNDHLNACIGATRLPVKRVEGRAQACSERPLRLNSLRVFPSL
jgi:hypothetical protein